MCIHLYSCSLSFPYNIYSLQREKVITSPKGMLEWVFLLTFLSSGLKKIRININFSLSILIEMNILFQISYFEIVRVLLILGLDGFQEFFLKIFIKKWKIISRNATKNSCLNYDVVFKLNFLNEFATNFFETWLKMTLLICSLFRTVQVFLNLL